jgi:hypothetical protein
MRIEQAVRTIKLAVRMREPVLLVGAPGVGKSDVATQVAESLGYDMILSHPVVSDPTDFKGLPFASEDRASASFLPFGDLKRALDADRPTIWMFDDLGQAPQAVQAALMQLLLAREVNSKRISDRVTFVAATNRRQDRAGVGGLLEPVKSRFASIIEIEAHRDDWCRWAGSAGVAPEVIAFIMLRPEALHEFVATADMTNSPSPRAWSKVSKWLQAGIEERDMLQTFTGTIGLGRASEFVGFIKMFRGLVKPDQILLNPETAPVPEDMSAQYAVASALAHIANDRNFGRIHRYALRLPRDIGVLLVKQCERRNPKIVESPDWNEYVLGPIGQEVLGA